MDYEELKNTYIKAFQICPPNEYIYRQSVLLEKLTQYILERDCPIIDTLTAQDEQDEKSKGNNNG